jgi:hypothetical protein
MVGLGASIVLDSGVREPSCHAWCSISTVPLVPSARTRSPLRRSMVALPHPTTAGMPP